PLSVPSARPAAIPEAVSDTRSIDYGLGLIKLAELEQQRNRRGEAEAFYAKAAQVLGERREAAPALLFLGQSMIVRKDFPRAFAYFERAERLDRSKTALARMWI